ncbi:MAG: hypothetical protein M3P34_10865, partial [Actinomycetota bacterium]|nr:hypothetical protein [Actinomycetota bacterium]
DGPVHLRRRWDDAVTAVAAYHDTWSPEGGGGSWGWAIGAPVANPAAAAGRTKVIERLDRFALAYALEAAGADPNPDRLEERVGRLRDGERLFARHARASHRTETDQPTRRPTARRRDTDTPVGPQQPTRRRPLRR